MPSTNGRAARTPLSKLGRAWPSSLSRPFSRGFEKQKRSPRITNTSNTQTKQKKQFKYFFKKFHVFANHSAARPTLAETPRVREWERGQESGDHGG
jgi:hypothetical protein